MRAGQGRGGQEEAAELYEVRKDWGVGGGPRGRVAGTGRGRVAGTAVYATRVEQVRGEGGGSGHKDGGLGR